MQLTKRLGALLAALALGLMMVTPALATDIKDSQVPTDGSGSQGSEEDCAGFDEEGMVLWHFIFKDSIDHGSVTLTAYFDSDGEEPYVADETRTDTDPTPQDSFLWHFTVTTPEGWVLVDASTDKGGAEDADTFLNLSHTCFGPPEPPIPEAPIALMLPLLAIAAFGVYFFRNRRTSALVA